MSEKSKHVLEKYCVTATGIIEERGLSMTVGE